MRVEIPFEVNYQTAEAVPIDDVIASLVSLKALIEEGSYNLPLFLPGLKVEGVSVSVRRVSQESPLRELLLVGMFLALQKDLEREVPALTESIIGTPVPDNFKTILTLSVMIAVFYGAAYIKDLVVFGLRDSKIKRQLDEVIKDLAQRTGQTEDEVRKFLDERYKPKGRIKALADATFGFFKPSKSQSNAPILVNDRRISSEVVADLPADYAYDHVLESETSRPFNNIDLEIHAQDRDRENSGWAAIPGGITDRRVKMKLMDGVAAADLWGRDRIRGDVIVVFKRTGTEMVPTEIHLTRIRD